MHWQKIIWNDTYYTYQAYICTFMHFFIFELFLTIVAIFFTNLYIKWLIFLGKFRTLMGVQKLWKKYFRTFLAYKTSKMYRVFEFQFWGPYKMGSILLLTVTCRPWHATHINIPHFFIKKIVTLKCPIYSENFTRPYEM